MTRSAAPTGLRVEHWTADRTFLGIGHPTPRLSWVVTEADPDFRQSVYEVEISPPSGPTEVVRVESPDQVLVPWPGEPLGSRERVEIRVRVRGTEWSGWSEPVEIEAGLLDPSDWSAAFISPVAIGGLETPAPIMHRGIVIPGDVARARLYITAHGVHVPFLNGARATQDVLAPGWTSYQHRLRYQTYDVTPLLHAGENSVDVLLGNGWFRGRLGWQGQRAQYGDRLALLAQLEVTTVDGLTHRYVTDESWSASKSGSTADDLYDGQHIDLTAARSSAVTPVERVDADLGRLVAPDGPPVRVTQVLPAIELTASPDRTIVDFGQNLVGWVRLRVRNRPPGSEVTVRHAEVLEAGELATRPLRSAKATDTYTVAGEAEEVLEPTLTFHGFRYAEITGAGDLAPADVEAVVAGTDMRRVGWFASSDPLLDRLHDNVVWSMRGNFLDIPTDCPQRDERLGWTGDIQVFGPTATFLFDCAGLLTSWLKDLAADQLPDGSVPVVVPDVLGDASAAAAAWGDAAVLVPWTLYQRTGDAAVLARQLPSMCAWVDHVAALAGPDHLWAGGFQYGDWLDPTAPPDEPARAKTPPDIVATAYFARSAQTVADAARVVGEHEAANRYERTAAAVRAAFAREYVSPSGRMVSDSPTAYAMAIVWDLLPDATQRAHAGRRLADLVRTGGFRISTGFVGTPLICDALVAAGEAALAYRLLLQTRCPSWLYPVTMGATTVWERWDSLLPDGSVNPGSMTSFNHYALGAVADWMHRTVAGLAPASPGYRSIEVRPVPTPHLEFASATHQTPYGEAAVSWRRANGQLSVQARIPVGSSAAVYLPGADEPQRVGHGTYEWQLPDPTPPAAPEPARTVRDVFDHPDAWSTLAAAAVDLGIAADDIDLAARLSPYLDAPAAELVGRLTRDRTVDGADALRRTLHPFVAQHP